MPERYFHADQLRQLKETVRFVFWTKRELRGLFNRCGVPATILGVVNWSDITWNIVDEVLEPLNASAVGIGPLRKIADETLRFRDGKHLGWAGNDRVEDATKSLNDLRAVIGEHADEKERQQRERAKRDAARASAKNGQAFSNRLQGLCSSYQAWIADADANRRGIALEVLLNSLFDLFDLASNGSFRRVGEQIDGALRLDSKNCLCEAKWQAEPVNLADLRDLDAAVGTTLETTLGLYVSINGFSVDGLTAYLQGNRPKLVCMDGADLMLVLEGRIRLDDLLRRKIDLAAERRLISISAMDIISGRF